MTYYFTSDTHYGHANVIKYSNRPFAHVDEMNEAMIAAWNRVVKPDDVVWHLGDFSFMTPEKTEAILMRLNGRKNLVFGNHDKGLRKDKRILGQYFERAVEKAFLKIPCKGAGKDDHQYIVLNHFPELTWDKGHHGSWMLHGHCHGSVTHPWGGKIQDVGVDAVGCEPISFERLVTMMEPRALSKHHDR